MNPTAYVIDKQADEIAALRESLIAKDQEVAALLERVEILQNDRAEAGGRLAAIRDRRDRVAKALRMVSETPANDGWIQVAPQWLESLAEILEGVK